MKRVLPLLLLLLWACDEKVEVRVGAGKLDRVENKLIAFGVDTAWLSCRPFREVTYAELLIDGAVAAVDTFPGPISWFEWDTRQLPEGSVHKLQGRAISGSHEYLSDEDSVKIGYASRFIVDGSARSLEIYRPDGVLELLFHPESVVPPVEGNPLYPRLMPGCHKVVCIADRKLYSIDLKSGTSKLLAEIANGIYSCDASPVSDLVAFEGYPAGTAHLFTVDTLGNIRQLTHDSDYAIIDSSKFTFIENSFPVFSPDGMKLACYRKSECKVPGDPHRWEKREDVFVMDRDGSNPVNLTSGIDDYHFSGFTWTFDGKWVLFRAGTTTTPKDIIACNLRGRTITYLEHESVSMACSPQDSTMNYVSLNLEHYIFSLRLAWTDDTIYAVGPGVFLCGDDSPQRSYIDWVRYTEQ